MSGIDSDLIRGHIDTIILKTLFDGDKYGYEILDEVAKKSEGAYELKQPTLYSCLKRLESQGLISSYWVDSEIGGKRHYYCLTEQGKETYAENQKNWLRSRQIIDNLIWENAPELPERVATSDQPQSQPSQATEVITEQPETINTTPLEETTEEMVTDQTLDTDTDAKIEEKESDTADIMELLGHFDYSQNTSEVEQTTQKLEDANEELISTTDTGSNSFLESFAKHYLSQSSLNEKEIDNVTKTEQKEEILPVEVKDDFNVDIDEYLNSDNSFFDSTEQKDKQSFITPNVITDGYQSQASFFESNTSDSSDDEIISNFDDILNQNSEVLNTFEQNDEDTITPTYCSFGEEITRHHDDTAIANADEENGDELVDTSFTDLDSLYISPESAHNSSEFETVESQDFFENSTISETSEDTIDDGFVTSPFLNENKTEQTFQDPATQNFEQQNLNNYYSQSYQSFEPIPANYTDVADKKKINELTSFAKISSVVDNNEQTTIEEQSFFNSRSFIERNMASNNKNYDKLISDFEREGIEVRVHSKLVKETRESKTYVQTNKIRMTRNWISFCFISTLLAVCYALMCNDAQNLYDFSYKYFLIGGFIALLIPITSTIIYAVNPYKKKTAQYSPGVSLLLSVLIFAQLLTIIYCVNLQLGFFSFTQQYYNHLFWIIPTVISIYPILNSVIYMTLYNSKNFHS